MRKSRFGRGRFASLGMVFLAAVAPLGGSAASEVTPAATVAWFQSTEQSLMNAIAAADKGPWVRVMDEGCVLTTEEGKVLNVADFFKELSPLPPGLAGGIAVKELTVQELPGFAVVRYLADEWETVFGQRLTTKYRVTDTYRRVGPTWKMVAFHVSVVTTDPPPQKVATDGWPGLVGVYQLPPDGWKLHVVLRDGKLYGGRDPAKLKPFIPLTPDAFVLSGTLGEWIFVLGKDGKATHIMDFRKFEPLVWTRISDTP